MALNWHTVEVVLFELCGVDTVPLNMTGHSTFLFSKQREHVFALKRLYDSERRGALPREQKNGIDGDCRAPTKCTVPTVPFQKSEQVYEPGCRTSP